MCERKSSGKSHVDGSVQEQYKQGGEGREQLEMAMLECIAKHGVYPAILSKESRWGGILPGLDMK